MAVAQHTVQGFASRHKLSTGLRRHDFVQECVHGGVFHANDVARPFSVCRLGAKALEQLGARRFTSANAVADEFEIKHVHAFLQNRKIHHFVDHFEAQLFKVFRVRRHNPPHGARVV